MIQLKNGCWCSTPAVTPKNWRTTKASTAKPWRIHYRFYDPSVRDENGTILPKQVPVKGMNHLSDLRQRQAATQFLLDELLDMLKNQGYNPHQKQVEDPGELLEVDGDTPWLEALEFARTRMQGVEEVRRDARSVLKYVGMAARRMRWEGKAISEIKKKQIKLLLDYMQQHNISPEPQKPGEKKKPFTAAKYNRYRAYLQMLFAALEELDVIESNPVTKRLKKQKKVKRIREILTLEQRTRIDNFLKAHNLTLRRFMHVFFHSGGRETELFRLQVKNVNLQKQTYKTVVKKGREYEEVERTIKDIALPFWEELLQGAFPDDYVFSEGLKPGARQINARQVTRRWRVWIKGKLNKELQQEGLPLITADLYSLKHTNTTEVVSHLDEEAAARLNGHKGTAMVKSIYDTQQGDRKHQQLKKVANRFA